MQKKESTGSPLGCSHADAQHTHAMSSPRQSENNNKQEAYSNRQSAVCADLQEENTNKDKNVPAHPYTLCVSCVCLRVVKHEGKAEIANKETLKMNVPHTTCTHIFSG